MGFYNTTPLPTAVFVVPTGTGVNPLCILKNESPSQTLFVGLSACTPNTGIPLPPNASVKLQRRERRVRVLELVGGHRGGHRGDGCGHGRHHVVDGGVGRDGEHPGGDVLPDRVGTGQEALNVATSASTTTITTTTGSLFDHAASEVLYQW